MNQGLEVLDSFMYISDVDAPPQMTAFALFPGIQSGTAVHHTSTLSESYGPTPGIAYHWFVLLRAVPGFRFFDVGLRQRRWRSPAEAFMRRCNFYKRSSSILVADPLWSRHQTL